MFVIKAALLNVYVHCVRILTYLSRNLNIFDGFYRTSFLLRFVLFGSIIK